jgi:hypothetical protein
VLRVALFSDIASENGIAFLSIALLLEGTLITQQ